jgi:hypothetical protein
MVTLKNIAALILVLATFVAVSEVEADDAKGALVNVDYSLAIPLGEARSHTSGNSPQGLGLEVRFYGKHLIGGLGVSWQIFRDERQAPGTPSGAEFEARTTSIFPMLATGYYVRQHGALRTFVGAGLGAMLFRRTLEAQAEETTDNSWYGAVSGLVGVLYEITPGFGMETKLRYVGGFKSGHQPPHMLQVTAGITFFY